MKNMFEDRLNELKDFPVTTPDHYFDQLEEIVIQKWKNEVKSSPLNRILIPGISIAATITVIILVQWLTSPLAYNSNTMALLEYELTIDQALDQLDPEEVEQALLEMDMELLFEPLSESVLDPWAPIELNQ